MKKSIVLLGLFLVGCVGPNASSSSNSAGQTVSSSLADGISFFEGSIDTVYLQTEVFNFNDLAINYTKNGVTEKIIKKNDSTLTVSAFQTTEIGTFPLTISYKGFETVRNLSVVEIEEGVNCEVFTFNKPAFLTAFAFNSSVEANLFNKPNDSFYVGDDNPFVMKPTITVEKTVGEVSANGFTTLTLPNFEPIITVYKKTGDDFVALDDNNNYVSVEASVGAYDFSESAIGETFKIEARTLNTSLPTNKIEHIVTVIDGYNVTRWEELSLFDNTGIWDDFKVSEGLSNLSPNNLILNNDVDIEFAKLPSGLKLDAQTLSNRPTYTQEQIDSYHTTTHCGIFHHFFATDASLQIIGNYFQASFATLPLLDRTEPGDYPNPSKGVESHLYAFSAHQLKTNEGVDINASVKYKNIAIRGNTLRAITVPYSGGIGGLGLNLANNEVDNVRLTNFNYGVALSRDSLLTNTVVKDTYIGDTFLSSFWSWDSGDITILNSKFEDSGGPTVILAQSTSFMDESDVNDPNARHTHLKIDEYSFDNIGVDLDGSEAYFAFSGDAAAQAANKIKELSYALSTATNGASAIHYNHIQRGELLTPKIMIIPNVLDVPKTPRATVSLLKANQEEQVILSSVGMEQLFRNVMINPVAPIPLLQASGTSGNPLMPSPTSQPLYATTVTNGVNFIDIFPLLTGSMTAEQLMGQLVNSAPTPYAGNVEFTKGQWISLSQYLTTSGGYMGMILQYYH
ncbi:MAG: hypothetical protein LBM99_06635 [Bacillales bacterium]|jgi:hypothetical protein|nr:hypothetical protein [Bacillales bacterium]